MSIEKLDLLKPLFLLSPLGFRGLGGQALSRRETRPGYCFGGLLLCDIATVVVGVGGNIQGRPVTCFFKGVVSVPVPVRNGWIGV